MESKKSGADHSDSEEHHPPNPFDSRVGEQVANTKEKTKAKRGRKAVPNHLVATSGG